MVKHFNNGKCDGWLKTQFTGDHFPIGYYEEAQVPILGALAKGYTLFDNYHCSLMGATWPNRFYQLCAATDVDDDRASSRRRASRARPSSSWRSSTGCSEAESHRRATTRGASR